jgi:hypothetical protein
MPITLPPFVAPNEVIESSWGNAVVDALEELDDEKVNVAGDTITGLLGVTAQIRAFSATGVDVLALDNANECGYGFYGAATDLSTTGSRTGFIGFQGSNLMELRNEISGGELRLVSSGSSSIRFFPSNTAVATLISTGLLLGKTAMDLTVVGSQVSLTGQIDASRSDTTPNFRSNLLGAHNADGQLHMQFFHNSGSQGSITRATATSVAYNTTSDPRSKHRDGPADDAADIVQQLGAKAFRGRWHNDDGVPDGEQWFMLSSHDIEDLLPYLVLGERDAVDDEGRPAHQQVNFQGAVPVLFAALSQALDRIAALEAAA